MLEKPVNPAEIIPDPKRNTRGQFGKGNKANPRGRPSVRKEKRYLKSMTACVSLQEWRAITERAVADAMNGNHAARKWLSEYLMGTPIPKEGKTADEHISLKVSYDNARDNS